MNKKIITFIVVVVVVIIGFFIASNLLKDKTKPIDVLPIKDIPVNSISVPGQQVGTEIFISSLSFINPGFVVIHRVGKDGAPADIIGSSRLFPAGTATNVLVPLNEGEKVSVGDMLVAMLHTDNGDGTLDPLLDTAILDENGAMFTSTFSILDQGALENEVKL